MLGLMLGHVLLYYFVVGDGSVLSVELVDELLEVVVDEHRRVLRVECGATPYGAFNRYTVEDVDQPTAMLLGATDSDVLDSRIETGSGQGSRARRQIDYELSSDFFKESLVPRNGLLLIP